MDPTDPLSALRDIHLPADPAWRPPAPGWWVLAILLAAGLVVAGVRGYRRWLAGAARRTALAELGRLRGRLVRGEARGPIVAELSVLLRRAALASHPRKEVAGLAGERWLAFLDGDDEARPFSRGPGASLAVAPYSGRDPGDLEPLMAQAEAWIRRNPHA